MKQPVDQDSHKLVLLQALAYDTKQGCLGIEKKNSCAYGHIYW